MGSESTRVQEEIPKLLRLSVGFVTIAGLAAGAYLSLRLAWADFRFRENTLASVAEAVRLDPANARYLAWLAELREYAGEDPAST